VSVLNDGAVLENANVGHLEVRGNNVTVRNVGIGGGLLISGSNAMVDHVTVSDMGILNTTGTTVQYSNIGGGSDDAIFISPDNGGAVRNFALKYNYIHDPQAPDSAHYDGTQVRGADGGLILCSNYDPGPYKAALNAAIYLEDANGGTSNVTLQSNWINGYAFSIMMDARNTELVDNRIGGDILYGTCYLGTRVGNAGLVSTGNTLNGAPVNLCK
jgi:hypothetical protein